MAKHNIGKPTDKLDYITALRGIAALVVAVGHILGMLPPDHPHGSFLEADNYHRLIWPWLFGGQMVCLFLMVSGFALYWSEHQRQAAGKGATPLSAYAQRRFWRIAPTYYVALLFGAVVLMAGAQYYVPPSPSLDSARPMGLAAFYAHLFFVHNLSPEWIYKFNPPLWSIAVEVQLYLLFPLLLALGRKMSMPIAALLIMLVAGLIRHVLGVPLFSLAEFFLGGAVVAHLALAEKQLPKRICLAAATLLISLGLLRLSEGLTMRWIWFFAFASLLLYLQQVKPLLLGHRVLQYLGERSYSIYAMHFPVALVTWWFVARLEVSKYASALLLVTIALPIALVLAEVCYRIVEKPSLRRVAKVLAASRVERRAAISHSV